MVEAIDDGNLAKATALCETSSEPLAEVFDKGLKAFRKHPHKVAETVSGKAVPGGHYCAEEAPQETLAALTDFFG